MEGLTLVPVELAKPGYRFTFTGPNKGIECAACPVQKLCFNLKPGTMYEVLEVRTVRHPCELHDEGRVAVVKVGPAKFQTSLAPKHLKGTAATWNPIDCGYAECANWKLCHPTGVEAGTRYAIENVGKKIDCPMNYDIKVVDLKRMPE